MAMKVISLGWGVQSFTLAAMVALSELDPVDAAIHADTTHERSATYEFAKRWTPWLEERGVKVVTVQNPTGGFFEVVKKIGQTHIPAYTKFTGDKILIEEMTWTWGNDNEDIPTGRMIEINPNRDGQLKRSCTQRWKIAPMRTWTQANRNAEQVEQWIGISLDEVERIKPSDVKYITHRWPLIEKRMTRDACIAWLVKHDLEVPPKSSCTFCPFHNFSAWLDMKTQNGPDWAEAIRADETLRKLRPPYDFFACSKRIPLTEIKSAQDNGQLEMFTSEECSGVCFI
jgi:hypothetical protein